MKDMYTCSPPPNIGNIREDNCFFNSLAQTKNMCVVSGYMLLKIRVGR